MTDGLRTLAKLGWVELKLFAREPITVVFTLALPLMFLFVMGGVFGNTPDRHFGGAGPMNYYTPAYIGLVMASLGLIALPVHLAAYREHGILRRFRASSVSAWTVLGAQMIVSFVTVLACSVLLVAMAMIAYDVVAPKEIGLLVGAYLLSLVTFTAIGVLLGALMPTPRAAQGIGLILFFLMLMLAGAGPPPDVMTSAMRAVGNATPLHYVIHVLQDPWMGHGWNWAASGAVAAFMAGATLLSFRVFRWE